MHKVPLFDVSREHAALQSELHTAFSRVLQSGAYILGEEVAKFEQLSAEYLKVGHAVGLSNGSDALYLALLALGIGPGDEVITSPFTFVATAEAILRCGATPVFADIDAANFGLCPVSTARMRTERTRAVLFVHLFGHPGKIQEIAEYCDREGLFLIEDACQAFGACAGERCVGTLGDIGVFSFFPTKPLGGFGDGGLLVTANDTLAATVRSLRSHGVGPGGLYENLSGNYRLDAMQAALLSVKLGTVDASRYARTCIAERYIEALKGALHVISPTAPKPPIESAWSLFTVRAPTHRDELLKHLAANGVEARAYYPRLLSDQPIFQYRSHADELTFARLATDQVVSLPIYAGLSESAQDRVMDALQRFRPNA